MSNPSHERLLGFLLNACDADERNQIEQHLQQDESLRRDLQLLSNALVPLECDKPHYESPTGLAQRCCQYVYSRIDLIPAALSPVGGAAAVPVKVRRWSWLDISVAAAIAAAVLFLIAPAVYQNSQQSLKLACQNNLQHIGTALTSYSDRHGGYFPTPKREGRMAVAGSWAPTLVSEGYLPDVDKILCPSSPGGCNSKLRVPTTEELEQMSADEYANFIRELRSCYGYTLPYRDGNQSKGHRNQRRPFFAIVSDPPGPGPSNSPNHGGDGQNVLFEDGHVKYLLDRRPDHEDDDIFRNSNGEVAPGSHPNDSVIVPGHVRAD